jgi:simple sugar transport system permease protein
MQNFGVMQVYGAHSQVGVYAIAALLVGGATVSRATVKHALLGVILFHSLFILAPIAGRQVMGSALIGEYFRVFVANAVIAVALIMHAWKRIKSRMEEKAKAAV